MRQYDDETGQVYNVPKRFTWIEIAACALVFCLLVAAIMGFINDPAR